MHRNDRHVAMGFNPWKKTDKTQHWVLPMKKINTWHNFSKELKKSNLKVAKATIHWRLNGTMRNVSWQEKQWKNICVLRCVIGIRSAEQAVTLLAQGQRIFLGTKAKTLMLE